MSRNPGQLHLNAFLMSVGHHEAAWRLPESDPFANIDVEHYKHLARIAERGKLDSVFLADSPVLWNNVGRRPAGTLEPTVLLTALAGGHRAHRADRDRVDDATTSRSTWPAGSPRWTTSAAAGPAGTSSPPPGWRRPATSTSTSCPRTASGTSGPRSSSRCRTKLWDSWDDDASSRDKDARRLGRRPPRCTPIDHAGRYFRVDGPLNVPRSPQGYPLLVQAGSSRGRQGARRPVRRGGVHRAADARRGAGVLPRPQAARRAQLGRDPDARQDPAGHRAGHRRHRGRGPRAGGRAGPADHARVRAAAAGRRRCGVDPERPALDEELPADLPAEDEIEGAKSRYTLIVDLARRERLTVRQLIGRLGGGRGHRTFAGTPEQVADAIEHWFAQRRRRRLQHHAAGAAVRAGDVRRPRGADPAAARPVPHRVHRHDAARPLRPAPPDRMALRFGRGAAGAAAYDFAGNCPHAHCTSGARTAAPA